MVSCSVQEPLIISREEENGIRVVSVVLKVSPYVVTVIRAKGQRCRGQGLDVKVSLTGTSTGAVCQSLIAKGN